MAAVLTREEIEPVLTGTKFHQFLGIRLEEVNDQSLTIRLPYNELFYTSADGYIHGGFLPLSSTSPDILPCSAN